jgi:hypothetical protein
MNRDTLEDASFMFKYSHGFANAAIKALKQEIEFRKSGSSEN